MEMSCSRKTQLQGKLEEEHSKRRNSQHQGPKAGPCLMCGRNGVEACVAGLMRSLPEMDDTSEKDGLQNYTSAKTMHGGRRWRRENMHMLTVGCLCDGIMGGFWFVGHEKPLCPFYR